MGIFDSSSSSTTQNFTEETHIDKDTGFQDAGGVLALGEQSGSFNRVNVEVLDAGAVKGAFGFGEQSLEFAGKSVDGAFNLSNNVVTGLLRSHDESIGKAIQFAENSSRSANEFAATVANPNQAVQADTVKYFVVGLGVLSAGFLFFLSKK